MRFRARELTGPGGKAAVNGLVIAFAGHNRAEDLGDLAALERQVQTAFTLVATDDSVLLTGLAEGADTMAVSAWNERGLGEVHAVLPYLDSAPPEALLGKASITTYLDGGDAEAAGRSAHLMQTRWLLEDADLLVAVWTGENGRGAGGTADAVRIALERGTPVLWIKAGKDDGLKLISPGALDADFGFLEFLEQLEHERPTLIIPASAEALAALLNKPRLSIGDPEPSRSLSQLLLRLWEDLQDCTIWRAFALYRRLMGGARPMAHLPIVPPESLANEPGFQTLTRAYLSLDARASRLAAIHRSQQVFQATVMIVAVAVGAAPAVWPGIKIYAVLIELALALITFLVWVSAVHSERSRRWGEARRQAEQLRLERAAWALGLSTRDDRSVAKTGLAAQLARAWRRRAGAPTGRFDRERVQAWGGWVLDDLIYGQLEYHRVQGHINHRLAHRGHAIENVVFWLLVALLVGFVAAYVVAHRLHVELPHWVGGVVILAGAVTPAFGAASLALDAALAFSDQARRSDTMRHSLQAIAESAQPRATLATMQRAARTAIGLQLSQEDGWVDEAAHRHVVRGG